MLIPHELSVGDIYFSPILLVILLAVIASWITIFILNKMNFSRFVFFPSITFLAIMMFYIVGIDRFLLRF